MKVRIVYGPPSAGKTTYMEQHAKPDDLVVDIDRVYACFSNSPMYTKPQKLWGVMQKIKAAALDAIKAQAPQGCTLWILGGFATKAQRNEMASLFDGHDVECVLVYADEQTCIARSKTANYPLWIRRWFAEYEPDSKETWSQADANWYYHTSEWKHVRDEVMAMDHHECQACKARGVYTKATCVHHVNHIRQYPEHRADIYVDGKRNLVSLCDACHNEAHPEKANPTSDSQPITPEWW